MSKINLQYSFGEFKKNISSMKGAAHYSHAQNLEITSAEVNKRTEGIFAELGHLSWVLLKKVTRILAQNKSYPSYLNQIYQDTLKHYSEGNYRIKGPKDPFHTEDRATNSIQDIRNMIVELHEEIRIPFNMHLLGYSDKDIAKKLNKPEKEVALLIKRGLERISETKATRLS